MGGCADGRMCGWEDVWMGGWQYFALFFGLGRVPSLVFSFPNCLCK